MAWQARTNVKWIFLVTLLLSIGPLSVWISRHPGKRNLVWTVFGFLAVQHGPLHMYVAPISWAMWPGFVKGAEVSLIDAIALSIFLTQKAERPFPLRFTFAAYVAVVLLTSLQAATVQPSLFYAWQTSRVFFVALVVSRAVSTDPRVVAPLLRGMGYALLLVLMFAMRDRIFFGVLQATGGFAHQNQLGMITHFIALPFMALLLAGGSGWLTAVAPVAGLLVALLTASRGTIGVLCAGYGVVLLLSLLRRRSARKLKVLTVSLVIAAVAAPLAIVSLESRMNGLPLIAPDGERLAFERAASMMVADHPFGVGRNQFVVVANSQGYYERAGVAARAGSRGGHVHNLYWLALAETGYLGLVAYVVMLLHPVLLALRVAWIDRTSWRGEIALGLGAALLAVYVQSFVEWVFVGFQAQYLFGLTSGIAVGLSQSLRLARSSHHASERVAAAMNPGRRATTLQRPPVPAFAIKVASRQRASLLAQSSRAGIRDPK